MSLALATFVTSQRPWLTRAHTVRRLGAAVQTNDEPIQGLGTREPPLSVFQPQTPVVVLHRSEVSPASCIEYARVRPDAVGKRYRSCGR